MYKCHEPQKSCSLVNPILHPQHNPTALHSALNSSLQHEVPFINTSEATKRSSDPAENGTCTSVTNRLVGQSTPFYTSIRTALKTRACVVALQLRNLKCYHTQILFLDFLKKSNQAATSNLLLLQFVLLQIYESAHFKLAALHGHAPLPFKR